MEKSEIIRRLEKIARHAVHFVGEKPFVMSLDDGIAVSEVLELLKEQEAVEPKKIVNENFPIGDYRRTIEWHCGKCEQVLIGAGNYCGHCGKKVKWE